jgi:hypothetical protein
VILTILVPNVGAWRCAVACRHYLGASVGPKARWPAASSTSVLIELLLLVWSRQHSLLPVSRCSASP